jgi:hypothetical protein
MKEKAQWAVDGEYGDGLRFDGYLPRTVLGRKRVRVWRCADSAESIEDASSRWGCVILHVIVRALRGGVYEGGVGKEKLSIAEVEQIFERRPSVDAREAVECVDNTFGCVEGIAFEGDGRWGRWGSVEAVTAATEHGGSTVSGSGRWWQRLPCNGMEPASQCKAVMEGPVEI